MNNFNSNFIPNYKVNPFKYLRTYHDVRTVKNFRKLENNTKKLGCMKERLTFLHKCKSYGLIPHSLRIKVLVKSTQGRRIAQHSEKKFLSAAISKLHMDLKVTEESIHILEDTLSLSLIRPHFNILKEYIIKKSQQTMLKVKDTLIKKYKRLQPLETGSPNNNNSNWLINLSKKNLSIAEEDILSKGMNFAVSPDYNITNFLAPIEKSICNLPTNISNEIRLLVTNCLYFNKTKEPNLTNLERRALNCLRNDESIVILPADKGRATVVMDKEDYNKKLDDLLLDEKTYEIVQKDPTLSIQNEMNKFLLELKKKGSISFTTYNTLRCTSGSIPRFYGLPKIHKEGIPLRPIVSFLSSPCYKLSKFLSEILTPYSYNEYSVSTSEEFSNVIRGKSLAPGQTCVSFDVVALFTSIPIELACSATFKALSEDQRLNERYNLTPKEICSLLTLCLNSTTFTCRGKLFRQKFGTAMGSPVSPKVANIVMNVIEKQAINSFFHPPSLWQRYVDDTFCIINELDVDRFLEHLNSINSNIQFTMEKESNSYLPFLDVLTYHDASGSFSTSVYRKPTCTDRILDYYSHHPVHQKASTIRTLFRRANNIPSNEVNRKKEKDHLYSILKRNHYPKWFIEKHSKMRQKIKNSDSRTQFVCLPYVKGITEPVSRILKKYDINSSSKPVNSLRQLISHPKDPVPLMDRSSVVYSVPCADCEQIYVGQTKRCLRVRISEHKKNVSKGEVDKSAIAFHNQNLGHTINWDGTKVLHHNPCTFQRLFLEGWEVEKNNVFEKNRGAPIPDFYRTFCK